MKKQTNPTTGVKFRWDLGSISVEQSLFSLKKEKKKSFKSDRYYQP